jgi:hypothetical protein
LQKPAAGLIAQPGRDILLLAHKRTEYCNTVAEFGHLDTLPFRYEMMSSSIEQNTQQGIEPALNSSSWQ